MQQGGFNAFKAFKAFKAFNFDMKCIDMQYTIGQESIHDGSIELCKSGLHFCRELAHVFRYYPDGIFCAVEIPLTAQEITGDNKSVTNKLKPTRLLDGKYESLGNTYYFKLGKFHRDDDLPAIIHANGTQAWYKEGTMHRDGDQPA